MVVSCRLVMLELEGVTTITEVRGTGGVCCYTRYARCKIFWSRHNALVLQVEVDARRSVPGVGRRCTETERARLISRVGSQLQEESNLMYVCDGFLICNGGFRGKLI